MRCKKGDMALVIRSSLGNEGLVVECIRLAGDREMRSEGFIYRGHGVVWVVDKPLKCLTVGRRHLARLAYDDQLRPITPPPGSITDEEVRELFAPPVPNSTKETV